MARKNNQKNISGWSPEKQELLDELKRQTGNSNESEVIRESLAFYKFAFDSVKKFKELCRANKRGRPKKGVKAR